MRLGSVWRILGSTWSIPRADAASVSTHGWPHCCSGFSSTWPDAMQMTREDNEFMDMVKKALPNPFEQEAFVRKFFAQTTPMQQGMCRELQEKLRWSEHKYIHKQED